MIAKLIKLLQVIDQQGVNAYKVLKGGYSISSFRILRGIQDHCTNFNTIIDVGANEGQFAFTAARLFPSANIISFEPLPDLFAKFKEKMSGYPTIVAHNIALGTEVGTIDFYRNEHSHASSVLPISDIQKKELPETAKTTKVQVAIDRLDNVINGKELRHPLLLKLDVQGYEKNVLEGAPNLLAEVDYVVFEGSFMPMYQGEPLFDEMHSYLKSKGFQLIAPVGFLEGRKGAILQMDFLYGKK